MNWKLEIVDFSLYIYLFLFKLILIINHKKNVLAMMEKYNKMGNDFTWQMKKGNRNCLLCKKRLHFYFLEVYIVCLITINIWFHFDSNNMLFGIGIHYYKFYFLLFSSNKPIKNKEITKRQILCLLHFGHFALPRDTEDRW